MRTRISSIVTAIVLLVASSHAASQEIGPDPALTPEKVVAIQLNALRNNDAPTPDACIRQTFALAHPNNRRATGPLARFALMIRSPAYRPLLNHRTYEIKKIAVTDDYARFQVIIETPSGEALQYLWEVRPVVDGENKGAWLTSNVSPPLDAGQSL